MVSLLDLNVLIALAWPNHVHHTLALGWFRQNQHLGWATCPHTQSGFVRVSSNLQALPMRVSPREAIGVLRRIVALPHHNFWLDDVSLVDSPFVARERLTGHRQVSDAHLLAIALRHGGRLATLDHGFLGLLPRGMAPEKAISILSESSPERV